MGRAGDRRAGAGRATLGRGAWEGGLPNQTTLLELISQVAQVLGDDEQAIDVVAGLVRRGRLRALGGKRLSLEEPGGEEPSGN